MSASYSEKNLKKSLTSQDGSRKIKVKKNKGKPRHSKKDNYLDESDKNNKKKSGGGGGGSGSRAEEKRNNNNNDDSYRDDKNIYDVCKMVEKYMLRNCRKYNISPQDLYEELHYQLPEKWIQGLRFIIRNSERQQLKIDYDISQTDSNCSSEI